MKKILSLCLFLFINNLANAQVYGPYIGASLYGYKSNLFNSDDLRADSFQTYKITPGFTGGFDFGYLTESGVSINSGIQIGTCNQKYKGGDTTFPYQLDATTNMTFVKIPLTFGKQRMDGEHKMVLIYSAGFYYSYNASYKDVVTFDYTNKSIKDIKVTTSKKSQQQTYVLGDSIVNSYVLDRRPYTRHGFGAVANLGFSYKLKEKLELIVLAKSEFQITNAEIIDKINYSNIKNSSTNPILPYNDYAFGNYSKYMTDPKSNYSRAGTHPFNLGISIGLRYYLFEF